MTAGPSRAHGRRGRAGGPPPGAEVDGVLPVLKPPGMTSHDVVDACRRLFGLRRVGHAGTLDPAAAGVLLVCLGPATRLAEYLGEAAKAYRAEIWLGVGTDSHDSEGRLEAWRGEAAGSGAGPAPGTRPAADTGPAAGPGPGPDEARIRQALARRTGPQLQVPPAVSAVRQDGERAYRRHRQGEAVHLEPRPVTIYRLDLVAFWPGPYPRLLVDVVCSKGTYVRALARDLGADLGCPATLVALVRTAQGPFGLGGAVTLEDLARAVAAGQGPSRVIPPARALAHLPAWVLDQGEAARVAHGGRPRPRTRPWDQPPGPGAGAAAPARVRLLDGAGRLLAVGRLEKAGGGWQAVPEKVLAPASR
ncbi:tRNA pseudouridine synthase B [Thermaerobacter marianensis DSM 12885]|uniref:tRNA pseudouridine synthase B n=1 Tax=Thermaerobacter marianensis (strain ATCC 700841 / DSM 12885 / JCM 10246 / 7p75a) TaxID=644966 RepID=E6SJS3_THEM7|nr:tRNA pseudouridine(55) synthase TruB [Thermaerobacter marianensis]ADU51136.1 tRNA pseudouridine synthase B [Thermaerobacter marianensis DSM 12885]